ncbi:DUF167 domain-containing protein [Methanimicrococcus blatticola]|uniref:UPF0235 protein C7391_1036 n=1 Tax=Methanimicrococcus blatticola TaxID=91560 RepID=A0A484F3W9_9EURY|nr:DUF167 domain-containing protein [Methanimicrococcus blatticola]MBZ3935798.1 YggU family protein [Methanimicrococcus blatticola]MCC2508082.1 DUF167 domain-containing protein [Methanimicrococcus blatticola]TDQ68838.1 hypothetical protein C7391_1036 [Methanimicrococcus blatticola]
MPFTDALREKDSAIFIDLEVTPGSKVIQVPSGYNEWRKRIEVKITQAAQKGKANEQIVEEMAALFNISMSRVSIENGMTSSKKTVRIDGVSLAEAQKILESKLKE